jgi:hypothetical protein
MHIQGTSFEKEHEHNLGQASVPAASGLDLVRHGVQSVFGGHLAGVRQRRKIHHQCRRHLELIFDLIHDIHEEQESRLFR